MGYLEFHLPKCFLYLIILGILKTSTSLIRIKNPQIFKYPLLRIFLMFCPQTFAIILYFYQQKINQSLDINNKINEIKRKRVFILNKFKQKENISIPLLLSFSFLCTILSFISYFNFKDIYFKDMKAINNVFTNNFQTFILFSTYITVERYLLNFNFYRHHFIAFGIIIILFFIILFHYIILEIYKNTLKIIPVILTILIIMFSGIIEAFHNSIIKKLNNDYFINMNLILFLEGLFGILFTISIEYLCIIYYNYETNYLLLFKNSGISVIILILYSILIFLLNILTYKIIEETRPCYLSFVNELTNILLHMIIILLFKKIDEKNWVIEDFIICVFFFLSFSIFSEIITLNFCELDKYTKEKTKNRAERDSILNTEQDNNILMNDNSSEFINELVKRLI